MLLHWVRRMVTSEVQQPAATGNIPLLRGVAGAVFAGQALQGLQRL